MAPTPTEASTHDLEDSSSSGETSDDESQGSVELDKNFGFIKRVDKG